MLTPKNIENSNRQSGYNFVSANGSTPSRRKKGEYRWHARVSLSGAEQKATGLRFSWRGPARAIPEEAAQDYCDYVNNGSLPAAPSRPSAGHATNKRKRKVHPKRAEAYRLLAEARADESKNDDKSGYIYCIGEKGQPSAVARFKLGKSKDEPIYRLAGLQTGNPRILYVVASKKVADRHEAERKLHERFAEHCSTNEWFWASDILDEVLAEFNTDRKGVTLSP